MLRLTISYGYDNHSIVVSPETLAAIQSGKKIEIDGQGFQHEEDGCVQDHWVFNDDRSPVVVWLDNEAEFFAEEFFISE